MSLSALKNFLVLVVLTLSPAGPAHAGQQNVAVAPLQSIAAVAESRARGGNRVDSIPFARTELFFGTSRANGLPPVSDDEFRQFLDQEITPRFPDGLTVVAALGQFRNASGEIIQERSLLLILLYPAETAKASSRKIERIRTAYKEQFQQESVLRVDNPSFVLASF